ncbi:MAG: NHLP family bacteriocin export ABC transporter peptidase/permease/ATPase subunit [Actinomycetota bacterium]|nr:NHLP family bacteriocin export ABC transporter peptidase/permease/ATPase subunit [Actinomycetota bacterium]
MSLSTRPKRRGRRVQTPTVLQMEAAECGAAALDIILGYHGRIVPLEELRVACGVSRDGSKASNIVRAARGYGMVAKGYKVDVGALDSLPLPFIVFWDFDHFLVVEGFGGRGVWINDPAAGPRVASYEEFDRSYTGVALTFEPGPGFRKGGVGPSLLAAMRKRLRGSEWALAFVVLASLALVVPGLLVPIFSQIFVDQYLVQRSGNIVGPLLLTMVLTALVRASLTFLQQRYLLRLQNKLALSMSGTFMWHVLRLPMAFYSQRYAGEIGSRVAINDQISQLLSGQLATTALNVVTVVFYTALMFYYDVVLTLIAIFFAALNIAALRYFSRKRVDTNQRLLRDRGKLAGVAMGGLQTIETLKATGRESDFFARWAGLQAKLVDAQQGLNTYTQVLSAVPTVLTALNTAAILGIGGLRVMDGELTLGMLVAFQVLMASFTAPIAQMVALGSTLQEARGELARVDDVLRYPTDPRAEPDIDGAVQTDSPARLSGRLEVRGVAFGYSPLDPPLIQGFSLILRPGSRVALVGASGSGKSTVAKLVSGLYSPWEGEILFDGRRGNDIPRGLLSASLAVVDQDIFLFEGTVRENLALWDRTIPEPRITQAARDALIHEDVVARPGGYDSKVDEGGANFSGGQRQRLEIARALVGDPTLLILDEATSALDPTTERTIDDNLRRRGCTCLIVAHRLSTIRDCDEILVLDRGKVVQRGTHEQLLSVDGPYSRLIDAPQAEPPN